VGGKNEEEKKEKRGGPEVTSEGQPKRGEVVIRKCERHLVEKKKKGKKKKKEGGFRLSLHKRLYVDLPRRKSGKGGDKGGKKEVSSLARAQRKRKGKERRGGSYVEFSASVGTA